MGMQQKQAHQFWLQNFADYFVYKHPRHALVKQGLVNKFAAALGQLWRLETASTLPASDEPSRQWPEAVAALGELSNWTPAALKVLELAMEHAAKGEKVLIGSDLILTGKWLSDRLEEKGVRSVHITEERSGKVGTKNPRKRAREVREFVEGDAQVLCAGVNALKLGHDLDVASTVIVHGLPYGYMQMDQFIARVHRLTSKRDVSVYAVIPRGSLAAEKWQLLKDKGGTSDLAFDGELSVEPEEAVNWSNVLADMKARGIKADGNEVLESDVEEAWNRKPALLKPASPPLSIAACPTFDSATRRAAAEPLRSSRRGRFR
jgi:SNF2 family DNA or RNA helicase